MTHRQWCRQWQLATPIVQAPMAGGATTPDLVAAVCEAGGLGTLAAATLSPAQIRDALAAIRQRTARPFAVNLFVQAVPQPQQQEIDAAWQRLAAPLRAQQVTPALPASWCEDYLLQLEAVLERPPAVVSFTFGLPPAAVLARCRQAGVRIVGTATTVAEGLAWQAAGADAVCAQGAEAGGHRGGFSSDLGDGMIGLIALVPQMADALSIPVIAAGGVMDGRGIAAALLLGASAVQIGTAFLVCPESGIAPVWKQALATARDDATRVTRGLTGRPARGLFNAFIADMLPHERAVPAYPVQNALTGAIRQAAARRQDPQYLSLWAGQGVGMSRPLPAGELVALLDREWRQLLPVVD